MHYAVPALLAQAGMLEQFYTDICGNVGFFKYFNKIIPNFLLPKPLKRLLARQLPQEVSRAKLKTCSINALINAILKQPSRSEKNLKKVVIKDNFLNANALYTNFVNSDLDVVSLAKKKD